MDENALAELLTALTAELRVPGAQAVVEHAGHTASAAVGVRSTADGWPMTPVTAVPAGSLTKPCTAALVMVLLADGDVALDGPAAEHLPELADRAHVTVRHLLDHTAGFPANVAEDGATGSSLRRWVRRHATSHPPLHPPGRAFSYSNAGYVVVGCVVETVLGMGWADAIDAVLLDLAGVEPAHVLGQRPSVRPVADGHALLPGGGHLPVPDQRLPDVEAPVGGLALSAADLAALARAAMLPTATAMREDRTTELTVGPFGLADGWGAGWARYGATGETAWWGHDGTADGASCHLRFDPAGGSLVALTANASSGPQLWTALVDRLCAAGVQVADHPVSALREPGPVVPGPADALGTYVNGDSAVTVERGPGDGLRLSFDGRVRGELICHDDLRFVLQAQPGRPGAVGRFLPAVDELGAPYLQLSGRLARRC